MGLDSLLHFIVEGGSGGQKDLALEMLVCIVEGKAAFSTSTATGYKNDLFHKKSFVFSVILRKTPNRCLTRSGDVPNGLREIT